MSKYKNIDEVFKSWGAKNKKLPANNDFLKSEILDKVNFAPLSTENFREKKYSVFPWFSLSFAVLSVLVLISGFGGNTNVLSLPTVSTSSVNKGGDYLSVRQNTQEDQMAPQKEKTDIGVEFGGTASFVPSSNSTTSLPSLPTTPPIIPRYKEIASNQNLADNREFLKTNYGASLYTRDVDTTANRIGVIVRGLGGRMDTSNTSPSYGYISFAIPADKLESFRGQIKGLTLDKLFVEQISTENLLPQKQYIEKEQSGVENNISSVKNERTKLANNHLATISSYNQQIIDINTEINALNIEWQYASYNRRLEISARLSQLYNNKNIVEANINKENTYYGNRLASINTQLKNLGSNLNSIKEDNTNLLENVATVNGSLNLNHISLWKMADIYTPGPLLAWVLGVVAFFSYLWSTRGKEIVIN